MDEFDETVEVFCRNLRLLLVNGKERFQKNNLRHRSPGQSSKRICLISRQRAPQTRPRPCMHLQREARVVSTQALAYHRDKAVIVSTALVHVMSALTFFGSSSPKALISVAHHR